MFVGCSMFCALNTLQLIEVSRSSKQVEGNATYWESWLCLTACIVYDQLVREKDLNLKDVKYFIVDECDKVLDKAGEFQ